MSGFFVSKEQVVSSPRPEVRQVGGVKQAETGRFLTFFYVLLLYHNCTHELIEVRWRTASQAIAERGH